MSWYSRLIWEHILANYRAHPEKAAGAYRDALKQTMANFMFVLWTVLDRCPDNGEEFLTQAFLAPNYRYFDRSYAFDARGEIIGEEPRHFTGRNREETDRYRRIAIEAVYDYNDKDNRHLEPDLSADQLFWLRDGLVDLIEDIEKTMIAAL